jgi:hypothetical protein
VVSPKPEFRQSVRELAESQWRAPVVVVYLDDVGPRYDVPGRRKDGTVRGKRLIRRFFWNILRGTIGGIVNVVLSVAGGGVANILARDGLVTGPENAQALPLVDAARQARSPWLVFSPSHVAIVETGSVFVDPADSPPPVILWQAAAPLAPQVAPRSQRLTWPDGSTFVFCVSGEERAFLKANRWSEG